MKRIITTFLIFFVLVLNGFSQVNRPVYKYQLAITDDHISTHNIPFNSGSYSQLPLMQGIGNTTTGTAITVPFLLNFVDYATNGNSLSQIYAKGNFILIAVSYGDSAEANNYNAGVSARILYNYSTNGGVTWETADGLEMSSGVKSRWPDVYMIYSGSDSTIATGGRFFDGSGANRLGGVATDLGFGLGAPQVYYLPGTGITPNSDAFVHHFRDGSGNSLLGVLYQPNSSDSICFRVFDPATSTFGTKQTLFTFPALTNTVASYTIGASPVSGSGHLTVAYNFINEPGSGGDPLRSIRVQTSSNEGTTWNAPVKVLGDGIINGDSTQPYWHEDIAYKPGTSDYHVVFSTFDYTSSTDPNLTRRAWKIVMQSPVVNGGNPVVVADWNDPAIEILNDLTEYTTFASRVDNLGYFPIQVNAAYLSHPSIGFSEDGSVIYVAYSVVQKDTSTVGLDGRFYNFFDVYLSSSSDGGNTWVTQNVTQTPSTQNPSLDEMYPVVSEHGNTNTHCHLTWQSTSIPGSCNFGPGGQNPQSPTIRSAQMYQLVERLVGIKNISSQVPGGFKLHQNFPNPFNPSTSIRFDITKSTRVTLKVYDITGKIIATLADNEAVTPGTKEVSFDAANYSTGIYFYTLDAGDFKETKKMMLIK